MQLIIPESSHSYVIDKRTTEYRQTLRTPEGLNVCVVFSFDEKETARMAKIICDAVNAAHKEPCA